MPTTLQAGDPRTTCSSDWPASSAHGGACIDGIVYDRLGGANRDQPVVRDDILTMTRRLTDVALAR